MIKNINKIFLLMLSLTCFGINTFASTSAKNLITSKIAKTDSSRYFEMGIFFARYLVAPISSYYALKYGVKAFCAYQKQCNNEKVRVEFEPISKKVTGLGNNAPSGESIDSIDDDLENFGRKFPYLKSETHYGNVSANSANLRRLIKDTRNGNDAAYQKEYVAARVVALQNSAGEFVRSKKNKHDKRQNDLKWYTGLGVGLSLLSGACWYSIFK